MTNDDANDGQKPYPNDVDGGWPEDDDEPLVEDADPPEQWAEPWPDEDEGK